MAGTPFQPSLLGAIPFDIYNDAAIPSVPSPILPGGGCNFVDLTPGANGSKCGCRRFWSRQAVGSPMPDQVGWCMCNHHACYHDEETVREVPLPPMEPLNNAEQENERPKTGRDPLSPVLAMPLEEVPVVSGYKFPSFGDVDNLSFIHRDPDPMDQYLNTAPASTHQGSSMPDTLAWGDGQFASPSGAMGLPPIPAQCLMPSQTASTTSSIHARYLRPFAGKGLQTLSGVTKPPLSQDTRPVSPTVVGRDSSFARQLSAHGSQSERGGGDGGGRAGSSTGVSYEMFKNMSDTVGTHEQRLDRLETVSFSAHGHDDCHEKHDHFDLRVTDLESRMEEVEKLAANDNGSISGRREEKGDDTASLSVASVSTSMTSRPVASQELYSQVQTLSAQVRQLQSVMPTFSQPWEVEVIFLPFPLKKVWQDIQSFKMDTSKAGDEWTQMTVSSATLRSQSPFHSEWAPAGQAGSWLLPRACGDTSIADRRLRSRGLIRTISVKGPDARSVQLAIHSVFGDVFRRMRLPERPMAPYAHLSHFLGLQSAWVPLRKIHKDSRLRFLSPGEMISTAMWDVPFLSSVMMKSAMPRLFVTHPDAYIQDHHAFEVGWSWQRLHELQPVGFDVTESQESIDGAANEEEFWTWSEQLDGQPGPAPNAAPNHDERYIASPLLPHQAIQASASRTMRSPTPTMMRGQSPMLQGRRGSRPPNIRTASVPLATTARFSPVSGRRVSSSGEHRRPTPTIRVPQAAIVKRRQTRSPSHHRFTPRFTASPSPMPLGLNEYQHARGTTPFAYATPHSNAPLQEIRPMRGSSLAREAAYHDLDDDAEDDDYDMHAYENDSGDLYGDDDDAEDDDDEDYEGVNGGDDDTMSMKRVTHAPDDRRDPGESQHAQLPEDEPWPGIEDYDHISDGENIDPRRADAQSDTSSQPSEYPSTQSNWPPAGASAGAGASEFHIHEDDDGLPRN